MRFFLLSATVLLASQLMVAQGLKQGTLSNVTRVTNTTVRYDNPQWSPDGSKIAFSQEGLNGLYVMDANGKNLRLISEGVGAGYMFQWSADSREILTCELRRENVAGRMVRKQAAWSVSVDGKKVKLTEDVARMKPAAWRYDANGKKSIAAPGCKKIATANLVALPQAMAKKVSVAPVQRVSAEVDGDALYVVDFAGRKTKIFDGHAFCPVVSPDGKQIAFNHVNDVCVINIDGTGKRVLARGFNPCWVNNSQIIFDQTKDDGHTYTAGELMMINVNGSGLKQLTNTPGIIEMNPSISADGSKVTFVSYTDGQIYVANLK